LRGHRVLRKVWAVAVIAPVLAVLAGVVILPWFDGPENPAALPARDIGRFFSESFERRTGRPLPAVSGDAQLAALIGIGPARPHLLDAAAPARTPWITPEQFAARGGIVVWRAADTIGAPPPEIAARFPGLVAEVPRAFDRWINGRRPPLRIGWAIVRPTAP
jgi:hypothetical protein